MTTPSSIGLTDDALSPGPPVDGALIVVVNDETESVSNLNRWGELVRAVLHAEGVVGPAEANVTFVDEVTMAELNRDHMGQEGPTDVLSFPIDGDEDTDDDTLRFVGDLIICPSVAETNAPTHAGTFDDELAVLLVHGTLHLLGHDHAEPPDRAVMWDAERRLMAAHWRPLTNDPWAARA